MSLYDLILKVHQQAKYKYMMDYIDEEGFEWLMDKIMDALNQSKAKAVSEYGIYNNTK